MRVFECVPNVSEGRDAATLDACARAIEEAGATLAHRTNDGVHDRSVFTLFGTRTTIFDAVVALATVVRERVDLRVHRGAHPRIGALDVVPFVPFGSATERDAIELARAVALAIWERLRVPSYYYGAAADPPRALPAVRAGGFEGLATRADPPDVGVAAHASAGAIAIGVRAPLVAFNVVLATDDLAVARSIARTIRERDGGMRTLRALGIPLGDGRVQVSCNITDYAATPLHHVFGTVRALAARAGVTTEGSELIGLVPRAALEAVAASALGGDPPKRGVWEEPAELPDP